MRAFALTTAAVSILAVASASAAPSRDALIRPGSGIGQIRIGMTFAQVQRSLGRHEAVVRERRYGFRSRYTEYAWGGSNWIVAVVGRGARARVVAVTTDLRRERTARGRVGVGSTERVVRRRLGARCFDKEEQYDPLTKQKVYSPVNRKDTMYCFLGPEREAAHTTFSLVESCRIPDPHPVICPGAQRVYHVFEVTVGEPRFIWGYYGE